MLVSHKKACSWAFLLGALWLIVIGGALAEQTGEIRGKVVDSDGEALPGVVVTAQSPRLQGLRAVVSDREGKFRLPLLPVGGYSLSFELSGFERLTTTDNEVRLGAVLHVTVMMRPSALSEEMTVVAANPLIDRSTADNSYRLTGDDLARIPSQARTVAEIVSLTPGVTGVRTNLVTGGGKIEWAGAETGLPSFRGEGDAGNNWLVDGLTIKGASYNDPVIRINYDAWEEVQIISDGFAPELGHALGGFVNIVTRSGGNAFHGEFGVFFKDHRLRAARREQLSVSASPATSLTQIFANFGGPLVRDKLWFFVSDNYHGSVDDTEEQTVDWLTVPAGAKRVHANNAFGKWTFMPAAHHTLSLSGTFDTLLGQTGGIGVPETYEKSDFTDTAYRLNYRGILSPDTLVTAAWGRYEHEKTVEPKDGDLGPPSYFWMDVAQVTNNSQFVLADRDRRADLTLDLTRFLDSPRWGSHEFGAGLFQYRSSYSGGIGVTGLAFDPWPGNGFDNGTSIIWSGPEIPFMLTEFATVRIADRTRGWGFYVQDQVGIGRISAMLGLRAETQKIFNNVGTEIVDWGLGDFLAPRTTLSFDLLGDGRNVLKFGYGRYFNPHSLQYLWIFNTTGQLATRNYLWSGPDDPTAAELEDPSNWAFNFGQNADNEPMDTDPRLRPNRSDKFLLEFGRQLGPSWALKVRGVSSRSRNLTDDVAFYDPKTQEVRLVYANFDLKRRDYRALEVELNGRIAGRFMFNASYTWSRAKGTDAGNWFDLGTWTGLYGSAYEGSLFGAHPDVPEGEPGKEQIDLLFDGMGGPGVGDEGWYGLLPYSVDHAIKILGTFNAPFGVMIASGIEYLSGYHWEKKGWSAAYGDFLTFPEGRGGKTTPAHMFIDLTVEKDIPLGQGRALAVGINAYNLLNSQRPVSFVKEDSALFGQVWARQMPRWVQLRATLRF